MKKFRKWQLIVIAVIAAIADVVFTAWLTLYLKGRSVKTSQNPRVVVVVKETVKGSAIQVPLGNGLYTIRVLDPTTGRLSDLCTLEFTHEPPTP